MTSFSEIEQPTILDGTVCRKKIESQKNKTLTVQYCDRECCKHYAEKTQDKKCRCCGGIIRHHQNYDALMKRFDELIKDNLVFFEGFKRWPPKPENRFCALVKIGIWLYKIEMRYFIEYQDLAFEVTDDPDENKYDRFFEGIKAVCPKIAF